MPLLYQNVKLRSHNGIRYHRHTGRPVGCGGASPFFMGLNALVSRNVVSYVRTLEITGEYRDLETDECARVGLVPNSTMMVSLLVRAAVDRIPSMTSFRYGGSTSMEPQAY